MMIGVSMAAAMILCISAFIWLYIQIGPLLSDFVSPDPGPGDLDSATTGFISEVDDSTPTPSSLLLDEFDDDVLVPETEQTPGVVLPTPSSPETDDDEVDTSDDGVVTDDNDDAVFEDDDEDGDPWEPTHEIRDGPNVNFRSGPNTISQSQGTLSPGTGLRFLEEEQPVGGVVWMYFDIEDGTEGWIRNIDVIDLNEDDDDDSDDEDDE